MNNLKLPNPKMMDIAVPANMQVGLHQEEIARKGWAVKAAEALTLRSQPDVAIVDLREKSEREKHATHCGNRTRVCSGCIRNGRAGATG